MKVGAEAAKTAHEADLVRKQLAIAEGQARGMLVNVGSAWRFACPACGAALRFHPDALALATDT